MVNPVHSGEHDACHHCTRCKKAVKQLTKKVIDEMTGVQLVALLREFVVVEKGEKISRLKEYHLKGLLESVLEGLELPHDLTADTITVPLYLRYTESILEVVATRLPKSANEVEAGQRMRPRKRPRPEFVHLGGDSRLAVHL